MDNSDLFVFAANFKQIPKKNNVRNGHWKKYIYIKHGGIYSGSKVFKLHLQQNIVPDE